MVVRGFQRLSTVARASLFSSWASRVYIWMGFGGVLMFKNFQGNQKVVFGRLDSISGVKFEFKSQFEIFAA